MKIAYFANQYPAPSHTFIRREILALEARGHTISRYAIRYRQDELVDDRDRLEANRTQHILHQGVGSIIRRAARTIGRNPAGMLGALRTALHLGAVSNGRYVRNLAYLVEAAVLSDWCVRDRVEHLHAHFGTNSASVAMLSHQMTDIPFSFTVHGPEEFDCPTSLALSAKIRAAALVVAVSSFGRSQLMRWADFDQWGKFAVVHCGVDKDYRDQPMRPPAEERRLVCIARLSEQKGHLILLRAAARLRDEGLDFHLVLVGDGPLRGPIETEIERLSLGGIVTVTGWLSQERIKDEILHARALVLPSFAEGLPVVLMEAMALARPVIATFVAGIPELVTHDNGWLVPAGNVHALALSMRDALTIGQEELSRKGRAARERVLDRHDIAASAERLERLFEKPRSDGC